VITRTRTAVAAAFRWLISPFRVVVLRAPVRLGLRGEAFGVALVVLSESGERDRSQARFSVETVTLVARSGSSPRPPGRDKV
jgi:hypothetical protein